MLSQSTPWVPTNSLSTQCTRMKGGGRELRNGICFAEDSEISVRPEAQRLSRKEQRLFRRFARDRDIAQIKLTFKNWTFSLHKMHTLAAP